ncbi:unnamed protein product [Symbiodinium necroappetens]|uniref:Uncharacterized protein n=1 Tax=Symbiodinium necroappetens TaxID=1628268 RepID=A0A812NH69_9DINO|nr:unnamed protein product [Symbiodinium necroappetens]
MAAISAQKVAVRSLIRGITLWCGAVGSLASRLAPFSRLPFRARHSQACPNSCAFSMSAVSTRGRFSPLGAQVLRYTTGIEEPNISGLSDKAVCQATTGWTEIRLAAKTE